MLHLKWYLQECFKQKWIIIRLLNCKLSAKNCLLFFCTKAWYQTIIDKPVSNKKLMLFLFEDSDVLNVVLKKGFPPLLDVKSPATQILGARTRHCCLGDVQNSSLLSGLHFLCFYATVHSGSGEPAQEFLFTIRCLLFVCISFPFFCIKQ